MVTHLHVMVQTRKTRQQRCSYRYKRHSTHAFLQKGHCKPNDTMARSKLLADNENTTKERGDATAFDSDGMDVELNCAK
jgi:hypothetical protein